MGEGVKTMAMRVFPRSTKWTPSDEMAFIGDPTLPGMRPTNPETPVLVSCTFSWDLAEAKRLVASWRRFYRDVRLGGPALGDPGSRFVPGLFIKPGVTFTSRGCPKRCPWCLVWRREGQIRTLPILPGRIIQDNNLLGCPRRHVEVVFDMLSDQHRVVFSGGLDTELFADWHRELLESVRYEELWFACDTLAALPSLVRTKKICDGISVEKMRCYVLIGFGGESLRDAEHRLASVYELGYLPFAQLFRGERAISYSPAWKDLARKWSRPAAYRQRQPAGTFTPSLPHLVTPSS